MAYTNVIGDPGSATNLTERLKRAQTHLAAVEAIVAEVDALLADPEDRRPAHGAMVQQRAIARGLPATFTLLDRAAAERVREQLSRLIEAVYQNAVVASQR